MLELKFTGRKLHGIDLVVPEAGAKYNGRSVCQHCRGIVGFTGIITIVGVSGSEYMTAYRSLATAPSGAWDNDDLEAATGYKVFYRVHRDMLIFPKDWCVLQTC